MKTGNYLYLFNYLKYKLNLKSDLSLSKRIGISNSYFSEIRNGKKGMSVNMVLSIARKTKIKEEILFLKICHKEDSKK